MRSRRRVYFRFGRRRVSRRLRSQRPQRRGGTAGGARDRAGADGLLLLRGLLGVAVPGAVGGGVLVRAPGTLGMGRGAGGAGGRDAQRWTGAGRADADPLPVRAAGGSCARLPAPPLVADRGASATDVRGEAPGWRRRAVVGGAAVVAYMAYLALAGGSALQALPRPGSLEQAVRGAVRRRVGRRARGLRGRAPAALLPAPHIYFRCPVGTRS